MRNIRSDQIGLSGSRAGWVEKPLHELASITMGQSPPSKSYNLLGQGIPLVQGNADIKRRKTIDRVWTTEARKVSERDDIVMTVRAPVGQIAMAHTRVSLGRGVCGIKPHGDRMFLYYALVHSEDHWRILEQGSTFTAVDRQQVSNIRIPVPVDLHEQRVIAKTLSDIDNLLDSLNSIIAKKLAIKKATMQQLLTGKSRLPGFNDEWRKLTLGEFIPFSYGKSLHDNERGQGSSVPVFGSNGIIDFHNRQVTNGPTIIVGRKGSVGQVHHSPNPCWPIDTTFFYTDNDSELTKFKYYLLSTLGLTSMNSDSAVPGLNRSEAHQLTFNIPGEAEQRAIAEVLSDMDAEIAALERRRDKTADIKQSMMQNLLTGKVRLGVAE